MGRGFSEKDQEELFLTETQRAISGKRGLGRDSAKREQSKLVKGPAPDWGGKKSYFATDDVNEPGEGAVAMKTANKEKKKAKEKKEKKEKKQKKQKKEKNKEKKEEKKKKKEKEKEKEKEKK